MFYDKYKELCAKKGISPFAAARDLGISSRTQGNWKQGSEPRFSTLLKIAEYFRVDVSYFDDDDDKLTDEIEDTPLVRDFIKQMNELTDDEQLLLDMFRTMTDEQKTALMKEAMRIKLK
jgi:transcriptional regulator with XRE-family HTH domain